MSKVEKGNKVKVHYRGTLEDGREFDNSRKRGYPIGFEVGEGAVIRGFETAVLGMEPGESKEVTLTPKQAYGPINPNAIIEVEKGRFPEDFQFVKDGYVRSQHADGRPVFGRITEVKDETVILDVNHPMAGKELTFHIDLVEIEDDSSSPEADTVQEATEE